MKLYQCDCGAPLFFVNTQCLACGSAVAYDAASDRMAALTGEGPVQLCVNGSQYGVCNWLTAGDGSDLCLSCRLNRTIPDLSAPRHLELWRKMETAKRRTLHWLLHHRLPVTPRAEAGERGLAFDFLISKEGRPVITGHDSGLVTLNLEEADDSLREHNRQQLGEPYRPLTGHFRHEIAHYYWWLWFDDGGSRPEWIPAVRAVFGDDRADYTAAMKNYYAFGPPADWPSHFISAYAAMHPWEDWAETWAHYVLITDALETAASTGLERTASARDPAPAAEAVSLPVPFDAETGEELLLMISRWMHLAPALNEMSLSLGHSDLYPFTPAPHVLQKLHCIHQIACAAGRPD